MSRFIELTFTNANYRGPALVNVDAITVAASAVTIEELGPLQRGEPKTHCAVMLRGFKGFLGVRESYEDLVQALIDEGDNT